MARSPEPVVLELATLPREQIGPFLLLGLDKAAPRTEIDAHWADRVKWSRKQQVKVPLEDVNWAREVINDTERRIRADAASINADTCDAILGQFARRYGMEGGQTTRMWQPLDREKALADYRPDAEVPDPVALRQALTVPEVEEEFPAAAVLLEQLVEQPLDPWGLELPQNP
jgi:hypothetical protein